MPNKKVELKFGCLLQNKIFLRVTHFFPKNGIESIKTGKITQTQDNSLLTIRQIRDIEIITFVYKFINKLLPLPFDHSFKTVFKITKNTRSQSSLYPLFCILHITKQAMRYKGPLIWNNISFNLLQDSKSLKSFHSAVTKFFLTKPLQF